MSTQTEIPYNLSTGFAYAGQNINRLLNAGYTIQAFCTYKQWLNLGYQVIKGQKSTKCQAFGKTIEIETKKEGSWFRSFLVFNIEQVAKVEGDQTPEMPSGIRSHRPAEQKNYNKKTQEISKAKPVVVKEVNLCDYYMDCAASFRKKAEAKLGARLENTPKRQVEASKARLDGIVLDRAATVCVDMIRCTTKYSKKVILGACTKSWNRTDGYYGIYFEKEGWQNSTCAHLTIREWMQTESTAAKEVEKQNASMQLRSQKIDGFFPTPDIVLDQLFDLIGDIRNKKVLEPSAGMGSMALRAQDEGALVDAWEINTQLAEHISNTGLIQCQNVDCLEQMPEMVTKYDFIVMNPPFERKAGIGYQWLAHIEHMRQFLKPDGELWAIIPQGADYNGTCYWDVAGTPFEYTNFKTKIVRVEAIT